MVYELTVNRKCSQIRRCNEELYSDLISCVNDGDNAVIVILDRDYDAWIESFAYCEIEILSSIPPPECDAENPCDDGYECVNGKCVKIPTPTPDPPPQPDIDPFTPPDFHNTKEDVEKLISKYIGNHEYTKYKMMERQEQLMILKTLNCCKNN